MDDALEPEILSRERHLDAGNLSPRTVTGYTYGIRQFRDFILGHGMPTAVPDITREHIEAYISHVLEVSKPWTALTRYRDLQQFFRWQVEEELIARQSISGVAAFRWIERSASRATATPRSRENQSRPGGPPPSSAVCAMTIHTTIYRM
jgi:Phage integrase, N-terminal SAM-like domain